VPVLTEAELDRIARQASMQLERYLRDDAYQEAWLQFLRWPPRTRTYAWRAATSARNRIYNKERQFQRVKAIEPILFTLPQRDPQSGKYWRNPERYRETARLRMRRWRSR